MQISFKTTKGEIYLVSVVVEGLASKVPHAVLHVLSAAVYHPRADVYPVCDGFPVQMRCLKVM